MSCCIFKRILLLFILSFLYINLNAQFEYSIDKSELKQSRRLTIKEFFQKKRAERVDRNKKSAMEKLDKKTDAIAKRYHKRKQKKYVRQRMKESQKMANRVNRGKPSVDFITYMEFKIRRYYGRFF